MRLPPEPRFEIGWAPPKDRLTNVRRQVVHGVDLTIGDFETPEGSGSVSVPSAIYEAHGIAALEEELDGVLALIERRPTKAPASPRERDLAAFR